MRKCKCKCFWQCNCVYLCDWCLCFCKYAHVLMNLTRITFLECPCVYESVRFYIYALVIAPVSARVISNNCWVCSASPLRLVSRCYSVLLEVFVRRNKSSIWWWWGTGKSRSYCLQQTHSKNRRTQRQSYDLRVCPTVSVSLSPFLSLSVRSRVRLCQLNAVCFGGINVT